MKKFTTLFFLLLFFSFYGLAQKHIILNTTGYGFDHNSANGVDPDMWAYIQQWVNLTHNGQDAGVTAVRLHVQWQQYEPTSNNYKGAKLAQAVAAILALKPNMKVALHFSYLRHGMGQESQPGFLADNEIAKIHDGTKVASEFEVTHPSVYSPTAKSRFLSAVNDAMNSISAHYSNILYCAMGNSDAEEYIMPLLTVSNYQWAGMYEDAALQSWRTEYLPCRYPGQSNVTWNGNTYSIANAPAFFPGMWGDFTSEQGREWHRFASWGLFNFYKQFRDIVKSKSSSLKVIGFPPGFGTTAGNINGMHNSMLPISVSELDGVYTSEGGQDYNWRKIMALDVLKGTDINKIAAVEFDPDDLGASSAIDPNTGQRYTGLNINFVNEWIPRAFKHGADYVHLAMAFFDPEIAQMAAPMAAFKAAYLNGSYSSPARQAPLTTNIFPTSFTGAFLFDDTWKNQGGESWSTTDLSPKSVNMIDNGYWENIWTCSTPPPCDFNMTASTTTPNAATGASVTLNSTCSGSACSGLSYVWSGTGMPSNSTNSSVTFNVPSTAGTYTYTVTVSKSGCSNKTATVQVTVGGTCDFNMTAGHTVSGANLNLTYLCSGANCSGVTYAWSGNGASGSTSPLAVTKPTTAGTYTYTITASKSGCTAKTATTTYTVSDGGGSINQCVEAENSTGNGTITSDPNASNGNTRGDENNNNHYVDYVITSVPSAGNYTATLTYFSSAAPTVGVQINGGSTQTVNLAASGSWHIVSTTQSFTVALTAGNNTIRISGTGGGSCRQDKLCVVGSGGGCTTPAAPSLSASPATITTSGGSSTLTATGCSGGTINWSDGLGSGTSKTVSPSSTTTYTASCTINGCTSSNASVVVTVDIQNCTYSQCLESESMTGTGAVSSDPNASNGETRGEENNYNHYVDYALTGVPCAGTYYVTLRYYSSTSPTVGVQVNGGSSQTVNLSNSNSWNITWTTQQITVTLAAGNNTLRISGTGGGSCRQDRICVSKNSGSSMVLAVDPATPQSSAKAINIYPNPSNGIFETTFYLERGKKGVIAISDLQGRMLYKKSVTGEGWHKEKINLLNKASGTVLFQLQKENGTSVRKINIAR